MDILLVTLTVKKLLERIRKKNYKRLSSEKLIKRKGKKLFVKWKGCDSSFDSWIDQKGIVI